MTKKLILPIAGAALAAMAACNSSETVDYEQVQSSSTQVTNFYLTADKNVLDSLENVFFAIDQVTAQIFNADSLPFGTKVDKLIPSITTESSASLVQLEIPRPNMSDSIVDFLTNSTDSVDFSNGPVKLRVRSQSATSERVYEIRVNVHKVKPDTLAWAKVCYGALPVYKPSSVLESKTLMGLDGRAYCITFDGSEYSLSWADTPEFEDVTCRTFSAPQTKPCLESICTGKDAYYMINADGNLLTTTDLQQAWTPIETTANWHWIYGVYPAASGDIILGSAKDANGAYAIASYAVATGSVATTATPQGFPVEATSPLVAFETAMEFAPTALITSGVDSEGKCVSATWGFDGSNWAQISRKPIAKALKGMSVVAYDLFNVSSTNWKPVQYPALLAFGGCNADGLNNTVYYSRDWGLTWKEAPSLMQLPPEVQIASQASTFVYTFERHVGSRAADCGMWTAASLRALPPFCAWLEAQGPASRVTEAVTSWQCPEIFSFGGFDAQGHASTAAWRGVVLRYTFCPKY